MRLGISDSPLARTLIEQGTLCVDYLEVHGPGAASARQRFPQIPMLLHNPVYNWSLCHGNAIETLNIVQIIQEGLRITRSPFYSMHLGFSALEIGMGESAWAASPPLPAEELRSAFCASIHRLQNLVKTPLLLENLDYVPGGAYEHICEPQFITFILETTDSPFLLDLAHARISAEALHLPVEEYLEQLPLRRIHQLHVNRPVHKDGRLYDAHNALETEDYALLTWVLQRSNPLYLTLEYNQQAGNMLSQITRLRQFI